MKYRQGDLWNYVLRCYEIDVVNVSYLLQLQIPTSTLVARSIDGPSSGLPFRQLLWAQMEAILLVCNVVVLTEHAAEIAAREEHAARAIMTLNARLFTKVRSYGIYADGKGQRSDHCLKTCVHVQYTRRLRLSSMFLSSRID